MNKTQKILLLFLLLSQLSKSQNFFNEVVGGSGMDEVNDIARDSIGNIYSTGYFSSPIAQFGTLLLTNTSTTNSSDVFISKTSPTGGMIWTKKIGGPNQDKGKAVALDKAGNVFVTGTFLGSISFGPNLTLNADSGSADIFICKYDNAGNFLWALNVGGPLGDEVYDLNVDHNGNAIVTGQYIANAHFSTASVTSSLDTSGLQYTYDIFVLKLSGYGSFKWLKTGSAKFDDRGTGLAVDSSNNIFLIGQFSDTIRFTQTYPNTVYNTCFVMKMDSLGNELNMVKYSGSSSLANSVCVNDSNEVLICGDFTGNLLFNTTPLQQIVNTFPRKIYSAKFDNNLNFIYCNSYGSTKSISGKRIVAGHDLSYYIFGEFKCTFSQFAASYGTGVFNSIGFQDLFIAKFDNSGNSIWQRQLGGRDNEFANGLVCDNQNNPVIAGSFIDELCYTDHLAYISQFSSTIFNVNSFCNDNKYNRYDTLHSHGYGDGFISNAIDTLREPIDYFLRDENTNCQRPSLLPCIVERNTDLHLQRMACLPDTINACDSAYFKVNHKVQDYPSPNYLNTWSMGNSYDNGFSVTVGTSGPLILTTSSADGCYIDKDTIIVNINQTPPPPLITDNLGFNTASPPLTTPIVYCSDSLLTTVITATGVVSPNVLSWFPNSGANGNQYLVSNETNVAAIATSPNGCMSINDIALIIDSVLPAVNGYSLEPDTLNLCFGSAYNYRLAESNWLPTSADETWLSIGCLVNGVSMWGGFDIDSYNQITGFDSATFISHIFPVTSGIYNFTWLFMRANPCGVDTDFVYATHYINVNPGVTITPNVFQLETCELQTITLSAASINPFIWDLNGVIDSTSTTVTVPAFNGAYIAYYYMPPNALGYAQVCADTIFFVDYSHPELAALPSDGYICPGDSVMLTMYFPNAISYSWFGPGGLMTNYTGNVAYASVPGGYYCVAMNSDSCTIQSVYKIIKPYSTPYLIAVPSTNMVCYNNPANITVICNDNALVVWNSPLSGNQTEQIVTQPGVYSCTATSCGITTYCSITITGSNTNINLSILGPDTVETCNGQSVVLTASAVPGVNFAWNTGSSSQTITATVDGDYYVTATEPAGCSVTSEDVHVVIHPVYSPLQIVNPTVCYGDTVTLNANTSYPVQWYSDPNGINVIGNSTTHTINNVTGSLVVYVQALEDPFCPTPIIPVHVNLNPNTLPPNIYGDSVMCNFHPLSLTTDTIGNLTYYWSGPGGFTSNATHISTSMVGMYSLHVKRNGCNSMTRYIPISNINAPTPTFIGDSTLCTGVNALIGGFSSVQGVWNNINNNNILNPGSFVTLSPVELADSGTYQFFYDFQGCKSDTLTTHITVNVTNPAPLVTNDTVCYNATALLFADSTFTINWFSNSTGTQLIGTGNNIHLNNVTNGFTVYAQAAGVCPSTLVAANIAISPAAYAPSIYGNTPMCNFSPIILTTDTLSNYLYYWAGPNGYTANTSNASAAQIGQYTLNVDRGNCLSLPASVTVSNISSPAPGITGDTTLCTGANLLLTANSIYSNVSWYHLSNNGIVAPGSIIDIPVTQLSDTGAYYFYYDYIGCRSDTAQANVYIHDMPQVTLDSAFTVCNGQSITVTPTHSFCDSLYWVYPNSSIHASGSLQFAVADTNMSGIYTFHAGIVGCFNDTSTINITVNYTYPPTISNNYNLCQGDTLLFDISNDNSSTTYHWIGSNNTNFYTFGDTVLYNINISNNTVYDIIAIENGCFSDTATVHVNVQSTPPSIRINSDMPACLGDNVMLWTDTSSVYSSHWSGPGSFSATSDTITINGTSTNYGNYYVYLESSFGCKGELTSQNITVHPLPNVSLGSDTSICNYTPFVLQTTQPYISYYWNTTETTQQILVDSSGTFWVQVTDNNGCMNRDTININMLHCNLKIGNVVTPDGNGINDMFFSGGEDLKQFHLVVYNRWGQQIYETSTVNDNWNCDCTVGTYYYVIEATDVNNKKGDWKGFISIFK
jgi:hypothetical protein